MDGRMGMDGWSNVNKVLLSQKNVPIRVMTGGTLLDSRKPIFNDLSSLPLHALYIYEACIVVKNNLHYQTSYKMNPWNYRNPNRLLLLEVPTIEKYNWNCLCMCVWIYNTLTSTLTSGIKDFVIKLRRNYITNWWGIMSSSILYSMYKVYMALGNFHKDYYYRKEFKLI